MQQINCPYCGSRAQTEFEYHRDATTIDSRFADESPDEAIERVFIRDDFIGFHEEVWQHLLGCRAWIKVERHNRTHEIRKVEAYRSKA